MDGTTERWCVLWFRERDTLSNCVVAAEMWADLFDDHLVIGIFNA